MKKFWRFYKIFSFIGFVMSGFFLFSCGIQEIINVDPPVTSYNSSLYSGVNFTDWYCEFATKETGQTSSFSGTEVYYKIYNNYNDLISQRNSILNVNTASNNIEAATRMIETHKYQPLKTFPEIKQTLFVPSSNNDKRIAFRPKTYKGNEDYVGDSFQSFRAFIRFGNGNDDFRGFVNGYTEPRYLKYDSALNTWSHSDSIGGTYIAVNYSDITLAVPARYDGKSFDFFDDQNTNNTRNVKPNDGDTDYVHNSTASKDDTYYVQFFAVGIAFDGESLSNTYSLVLDLGSMPIIKDK